MNVTVILQDQSGITVLERAVDLSAPLPDLVVYKTKKYTRYAVSDRRLIFREIMSQLDFLDRGGQ